MVNNYCIYRHLKSCGEVFYIGIGNIKRPFERRHRNNIWTKMIKKYPNYEIQVLKTNLSLEEAKDLEKILISWYGRKCDKSGTLCNISLGGEGAFGVKHSEETRKKMGESRKGIPSWNKGLKLSEQHKEQLVKNSGNAKKVINIITGEIYNSGAECARKNNYNYITLQQQLNGTAKNKTPFQFLDSEIIFDREISDNKPTKNNRKILNTDNGVIYNSITEAANCLGVKRTTLNAQLSGQNKLKFNVKYLKYDE